MRATTGDAAAGRQAVCTRGVEGSNGEDDLAHSPGRTTHRAQPHPPHPHQPYQFTCIVRLALCACHCPPAFHRSPSDMTLRKGSTLFLVAATFMSAAMLFAIRPTAAMRALSVIASVTQPMAAAGSDTTAN